MRHDTKIPGEFMDIRTLQRPMKEQYRAFPALRRLNFNEVQCKRFDRTFESKPVTVIASSPKVQPNGRLKGPLTWLENRRASQPRAPFSAAGMEVWGRPKL